MLPQELSQQLREKGLNKDGNFAPDLGELIGFCGEEFITLTRSEVAEDRVVWFAFSVSEEGKGETPEDAVCRLCLKLNK